MNKNSRVLRQRFFRERIPAYKKNPVLFAREVLLFNPDEWQKEVLMDLARKPKVAVKSGQGVGKTGLEAASAFKYCRCYQFRTEYGYFAAFLQLRRLCSAYAAWRDGNIA